MSDLHASIAKIAEIDRHIRSWKWTPDNPFPKLLQETFITLEEICRYYLDPATKPGERHLIRQTIAAHKALRQLLFHFLQYATQIVQSTRSPEWVRMGLAAASLEDLEEDARETYGHLGDLFLAAVQAGINPISYFKEVSEISSSAVKNISNESMKSLLAEFPQSPYFEKELQPKL